MDLIRLLHEIDGQLGLAVHRGEGDQHDWKVEANQLIGRIREAIAELELTTPRPSADYVTPEQIARYFHDEYERMAPTFAYETREASAVPWEHVPENNRRLMMAVATSVLLRFFPDRMSVPFGPG